MPSRIQRVMLSIGKCSWRRKSPLPLRIHQKEKEKKTRLIHGEFYPQYIQQAKVWQCVTTPIKVVPREHQSSDEPQTPKQDPQTPDPEDRSATPRSPNRAGPDRPLLNNGNGNWQYLWWVGGGPKRVSISSTIHKGGKVYILNWMLIPNPRPSHLILKPRPLFFLFYFCMSSWMKGSQERM